MLSEATSADSAHARVKMRKVIPTYNTKISFILSVIQLVCAGIILVFAIVNFGIKGFVSAGGSALLACIGLFSCGAFGIAASKNKEIWAVTLYFLTSFLAIVFSITLMVAAGIGIMLETSRSSHVHSDVREAIDIVFVVVAIVTALSLIWSLTLTAQALFYGCCKQVTGATYISEPHVQYKPEDHQRQDEKSMTVSSEDVAPTLNVQSVYI